MTKTPWLDEPNMVRFTHAGIKCLVLRHKELKHLCGYVRLKRGNHLYNQVTKIMKKYNPHVLINRRMKRPGYTHTKIGNLNAHGGITWCGAFHKIPARGLWIGFDCAHYGDLAPGIQETLAKVGITRDTSETYRDIAYVTEQTKALAEQLADLLKGKS